MESQHQSTETHGQRQFDSILQKTYKTIEAWTWRPRSWQGKISGESELTSKVNRREFDSDTTDSSSLVSKCNTHHKVCQKLNKARSQQSNRTKAWIYFSIEFQRLHIRRQIGDTSPVLSTTALLQVTVWVLSTSSWDWWRQICLLLAQYHAWYCPGDRSTKDRLQKCSVPAVRHNTTRPSSDMCTQCCQRHPPRYDISCQWLHHCKRGNRTYAATAMRVEIPSDHPFPSWDHCWY